MQMYNATVDVEPNAARNAELSHIWKMLAAPYGMQASAVQNVYKMQYIILSSSSTYWQCLYTVYFSVISPK